MRLKYGFFFAIPSLLILTGCTNGLPFHIFQTATPLPTSTPTASPTPTNTPLPTATPTPPPASRILSGDKAFQDGDYDSALDSYQFAFDLTDDPDIKAAALTMIGRIYYQEERTQEALDTLTPGYRNLYLARLFIHGLCLSGGDIH